MLTRKPMLVKYPEGLLTNVSKNVGSEREDLPCCKCGGETGVPANAVPAAAIPFLICADCLTLSDIDIHTAQDTLAHLEGQSPTWDVPDVPVWLPPVLTAIVLCIGLFCASIWYAGAP